MHTDIFTNLGLTPEQATIYQSLLENGPQGASSLAKTTSVQRTYIYNISKQLLSLGLIKEEKRGKTTVFTALSPDYLLNLAETQKIKVEQARISLESILPDLKKKYAVSETKPVVTYYEGLEGIKKVYLDTLKDQQPIYALVQTSAVDPDVYSWVTQTYVKRRVQAKIPVQAIVSSGKKTETYERLNEIELRETRVISSEEFPFEHEINIYGSKLAIINHRKGEKLLGIIIDNPIIAKTFKSWFDLTWKNLK